ncbi:MAG: hypothetical protein IT442_05520 [Phycisphaeraceae bacterium]|nr:hypothetical protein [Phycisphaeraceae bacterium]
MLTTHRLLLTLLTLLLLTACGATGPKALNAMAPEEREFADSLLALPRTTTPDELDQWLGPPQEAFFGARDYWVQSDDGASSQVRFYFSDGKLRTVRWIKLGRFIWDHDYKDTPAPATP